jgi:hypothetical protein
MTARQADEMTGCREDGVTAYRGERALGGPAVIQWEGGSPAAEGDAREFDLAAVVFWWSIYAIVIIAFVFHLAAARRSRGRPDSTFDSTPPPLGGERMAGINPLCTGHLPARPSPHQRPANRTGSGPNSGRSRLAGADFFLEKGSVRVSRRPRAKRVHTRVTVRTVCRHPAVAGAAGSKHLPEHRTSTSSAATTRNRGIWPGALLRPALGIGSRFGLISQQPRTDQSEESLR